MGFSQAQLDAIMKKSGRAFVPAGKLPYAGRVCETYIRKKLYALEDEAALKDHAILSAAWKDIRARGQFYADILHIDTFSMDGASITWRQRFLAYAQERLMLAAEQMAQAAYEDATIAYAGGYYGRLWLMDMVTKGKVTVRRPPLNIRYADTQILTPGLKEAITPDMGVYRYAGQEWRDNYQNVITNGLLKIKRATTGYLAGEISVQEALNGLQTILGLDSGRMGGVYYAAQLVTRAAIMRASNHGTVAAVKAQTRRGLQESTDGWIAGVIWLTSHDDRVCDICAPHDGEFFVVNDLIGIFMLGLPPDGTHYGCVLPGNVVASPGHVLAAAKSFYDGRAVEIVIADGRRLTVTANHPILTKNGWVRADLLNNTDQCFVTIEREGIAFGVNLDDYHMPTVIEKVFEAIKETSAVQPASMKPTSKDFYGDGRFINGDVDIVYTNRFLLSDIHTVTSQPISQFGLNRGNEGQQTLPPLSHDNLLFEGMGSLGSDMRVCQHCGSLLWGSCFPTFEHCVGNGAGFYSSFNDASPENISRNSQLSSKGLFSFSSPITFQNAFQIRDNLLSTSDNAARFQRIVDSLSIDTQLAAYFLDRHSGQVQLTDIVSVNHFDYSGYVYDMQTDPYQLYICNGVVVHNCRCQLVPFIFPDLFGSGNEPPDDTFEDWADEYGFEDDLSWFWETDKLTSTRI